MCRGANVRIVRIGTVLPPLRNKGKKPSFLGNPEKQFIRQVFSPECFAKQKFVSQTTPGDLILTVYCKSSTAAAPASSGHQHRFDVRSNMDSPLLRLHHNDSRLPHEKGPPLSRPSLSKMVSQIEFVGRPAQCSNSAPASVVAGADFATR